MSRPFFQRCFCRVCYFLVTEVTGLRTRPTACKTSGFFALVSQSRPPRGLNSRLPKDFSDGRNELDYQRPPDKPPTKLAKNIRSAFSRCICCSIGSFTLLITLWANSLQRSANSIGLSFLPCLAVCNFM